MERRTLIIGAVAGSIGLLEYILTSRYMNNLRAPRATSVKDFAPLGDRAALMAITASEDFYVTSNSSTPHIDVASWRLKIDGLVRNPLTLTYDDVGKLPAIQKALTLECISNPIGGTFLGNALWTGTPLGPLLKRADPAPDAFNAVIYGADGFSTSHPTARIWNEENFLACQMNGETLSRDHGYPVRIFIPGKYGMKQPKWVTRIEFVNHAYLGYYERDGWSNEGERWAHARFTDLKDGSRISGKNFVLTGYAVGNLDDIKSVEISFDDGKAWQQANLFSHPSALTWAFWKYVWISPQPGRYRLRVRATDGKGRVEGRDPTGIYPDGATGQQALDVTVA